MQKLFELLSGLALRRDGNVAVTFAMMAVPLISVSGIAVDYSRALQARTLLQGAVDAAALSGAQSGSFTSGERRSIAEGVFTARMNAAGIGEDVETHVDVSGETISITAHHGVPATFVRIAGWDEIDIEVTATAISSNGPAIGGNICVLSLDAYASEAFSLNGTTDYAAVDCATYSNSNASWSMRGVGGATASATGFYTAGQAEGEDSFTPRPLEYQPRMADPLAALPVPPSTSCGTKDKGTTYGQGEHDIYPGTFCGGLKLGAHANATFHAGIYVIKNGELELSSGSYSYGRDVHFHFVGSNAHLKVRGGADADLKAMTTGTYAGILFAQDPAASPGDVSDVQGGGTVKLVGALYFPTQQVDVGGNGDLGLETDAWAIIASRIRVHGNGQVRLKANFAAEGFPEILPKIASKPPHLTQ